MVRAQRHHLSKSVQSLPSVWVGGHDAEHKERSQEQYYEQCYESESDGVTKDSSVHSLVFVPFLGRE